MNALHSRLGKNGSRMYNTASSSEPTITSRKAVRTGSDRMEEDSVVFMERVSGGVPAKYVVVASAHG